MKVLCHGSALDSVLPRTGLEENQEKLGFSGSVRLWLD
jgi:hypothetical protein